MRIKTMGDMRKELGIVSQGRVNSPNSILFHLAFRLDAETAKRFILRAAKEETSESLWARTAIIERLRKS